MNDQIKKDNRKNLPRFLIVLLLCMLLGGVIGFMSASAAESDFMPRLIASFNQFLGDYLPWLFAGIEVLLFVPSFILLGKAKKLFKAWDGEDEELPDQIDQKLNFCLLFVSIITIFAFFALSASVVLFCNMLLVAAEFLLVFFLCTMLQKSAVDLIRSLNPEKKGSIFDFKFQKTWLASCDENERRQIGEASFAAFKAVNMTCLCLWFLLLLAHTIFNAGLLSSFVVLLIWGVLQISYISACIKFGRRK